MVDAYIALSSQFPQDQQCAEYVSHCANVLLSGLASVKSLELSVDTFMVRITLFPSSSSFILLNIMYKIIRFDGCCCL
jgi:hypothetical protein